MSYRGHDALSVKNFEILPQTSDQYWSTCLLVIGKNLVIFSFYKSIFSDSLFELKGPKPIKLRDKHLRQIQARFIKGCWLFWYGGGVPNKSEIVAVKQVTALYQ